MYVHKIKKEKEKQTALITYHRRVISEIEKKKFH